MDIKDFERYFIYNESIPYIPEESIKYRDFLYNEIIKFKETSELSEEQKTSLFKLEEKYNNQILYIKPVTVKDYLNFFISANCLSIEKNKIPDPKIISMSYLDFLLYLIDNDSNGSIYAQMLIEIFRLCLGFEEKIYYKKDEKGKVNIVLSNPNNNKENKYNDIIINKNDFDNIRNIILYQNIPDYDDTYIDPKVEKVLKEAEEFMNRHKKKMCSLEDQILCVMLALNETDESKIHGLTIRKFSKLLQRYDYKLHYEIYKTAELSGMVSFKEEVDHWMSDIKKNKYSDVVVEYDQFKNKVESAKV